MIIGWGEMGSGRVIRGAGEEGCLLGGGTWVKGGRQWWVVLARREVAVVAISDGWAADAATAAIASAVCTRRLNLAATGAGWRPTWGPAASVRQPDRYLC